MVSKIPARFAGAGDTRSVMAPHAIRARQHHPSRDGTARTLRRYAVRNAGMRYRAKGVL